MVNNTIEILKQKYEEKISELLENKKVIITVNDTSFTWDNLNDLDDNGNIYGCVRLENRQPISHFYLTELPGCCGVCVSYHAYVEQDFRNKGLGTLFNEFRKEIATALGYTILLCTSTEKNKEQKNILEKNEWETIYQFENKKTVNIVNLSITCL